MNRVEELIRRYCPDGVEFLPVASIFKKVRSQGKLPRSKYNKIGEIAIIDQGKELVAGYTNHTTIANPANSWILFGDHTRTIKWWENKFVQGADGLVPLQLKILGNPKFFYHAFKTLNIPNRGYNRHWSIVKDMILPVPPLEVQHEIVRILDSFTELEAELEAELAARRKQFEYYRDSLIYSYSRSNNSEIKLSDIAEYSRDRIASSEVDTASFVGVDNLLSNKRGKTSSTYGPNTDFITQFTEGNILLGNIRPYLRKIWFSDRNGGASGDVLTVSINAKAKDFINTRFLYHLLASERFFEYNIRFSKGAKMPRGDKRAIMEYSFPVPPRSEQERIVSILDKFDALVNDISVGLPAEITARHKQYEYYRDRLLSFTEAQ